MDDATVLPVLKAMLSATDADDEGLLDLISILQLDDDSLVNKFLQK